MNIQEVRKTVSQIKGKLFKRSNAYSVGILKSHFKGAGLQFKEHRVYGPGDDIRFIDWKLLAKTSDPYVKVFEEERNVEITVVIDAGATMLMGVDGVSKLQAAVEICCLLYLIAGDSKDFIRAVVFGDKILSVPKDSGERGITRLVAVLEKEGVLAQGRVNRRYAVENRVDENARQGEILKHLSKRREVIILSDLNEFQDVKGLKKIFFRSHLHCFQITCPLDVACEVPFSVYSKHRPGSAEGGQRKIFVEGEDRQDQFLGRKVKRLRVEERYLEKFVREMV